MIPESGDITPEPEASIAPAATALVAETPGQTTEDAIDVGVPEIAEKFDFEDHQDCWRHWVTVSTLIDFVDDFITQALVIQDEMDSHNFFDLVSGYRFSIQGLVIALMIGSILAMFGARCHQIVSRASQKKTCLTLDEVKEVEAEPISKTNIAVLVGHFVGDVLAYQGLTTGFAAHIGFTDYKYKLYFKLVGGVLGAAKSVSDTYSCYRGMKLLSFLEKRQHSDAASNISKSEEVIADFDIDNHQNGWRYCRWSGFLSELIGELVNQFMSVEDVVDTYAPLGLIEDTRFSYAGISSGVTFGIIFAACEAYYRYVVNQMTQQDISLTLIERQFVETATISSWHVPGFGLYSLAGCLNYVGLFTGFDAALLGSGVRLKLGLQLVGFVLGGLNSVNDNYTGYCSLKLLSFLNKKNAGSGKIKSVVSAPDLTERLLPASDLPPSESTVSAGKLLSAKAMRSFSR